MGRTSALIAIVAATHSHAFGSQPLAVAKEAIERIIADEDIVRMTAKLAHHPYLISAEEGRLSVEQQLCFAMEQYHMTRSLSQSIASLANQGGNSLDTDVSSAEFVLGPGDTLAATEAPTSEEALEESRINPQIDLFDYFFAGEVDASAELLVQLRALLGCNDVACLMRAVKNYKPVPGALAYAEFVDKLASGGGRAEAAVAFAVCFPIWGGLVQRLSKSRMCAVDTAAEKNFLAHFSARLGDFLAEQQIESDHLEDFMATGESVAGTCAYGTDGFHATGQDDLVEMAAQVLMKADVPYTALLTSTKTLLEAETQFWDACYSLSRE